MHINLLAEGQNYNKGRGTQIMRQRTLKPHKLLQNKKEEINKDCIVRHQEWMGTVMENNQDIKKIEVTLLGFKGDLLFISEMVDDQKRSHLQTMFSEQKEGENLQDYIKKYQPFSNKLEQFDQEKIEQELVRGNTLLLFYECGDIFVFPTTANKGRQVQKAVTSKVLRGSHDAFVEDLSTNLYLIRRRINEISLKVEKMELGEQTHTQTAIVYIDNIAKPKLVKEVKKRIQKINIDGILESSYIESFIRDNPYSPFPTINNSERPDEVCGKLLEGKVAIITDGTPYVLTVPAIFWELFQVGEDYNTAPFAATLIRWIRLVGFLTGIASTPFYVAIITTNHDLIPTILLLRIAGFRQNLPFPILVEALFLLITFEIVREAALRLPSTIGTAVTIVGTLVIGQAAVQAGIVGALIIIIIASNALTTFILPNQTLRHFNRFFCIPLLVLSGLFGLLGLLTGLMLILIHLCTLKSFGLPYLSPVSPTHIKGWKDTIIRTSWRNMNTRQPGMDLENNIRQSSDSLNKDILEER